MTTATWDVLDDPIEVLRREHQRAARSADRLVEEALRAEVWSGRVDPGGWQCGFNRGIAITARDAAKDALRRKIELAAVLALHEARP